MCGVCGCSQAEIVLEKSEPREARLAPPARRTNMSTITATAADRIAIRLTTMTTTMRTTATNTRSATIMARTRRA